MKPSLTKVKLRKTSDHYDRYPYDVGVRESNVYGNSHSAIGKFIQFIDNGYVLDIGCGPGNISSQLRGRADRAIGLDISLKSLTRAQTVIGTDLPISWVLGNALDLPFPDQSFDFVIAGGSLHHTPDAKAGFIEACRVLRSGGKGFVAIYCRRSYYSILYHTLGYAARLFESNRISALLVNRGIVLPLFLLYFLIGRLIVHRKFEIPAYDELLNYFADQILNPVVSFHSLVEAGEWARIAGVELIETSYSHAHTLLNIQFLRPL